MSTKINRIVYSKYTNKWINPANNSEIYYHEVQFENGDVGSIGLVSQNPPKIAVGSEVEYTITNGKVKIIASTGDGNGIQMSSSKPTNGGKRHSNAQKGKNPEEYIGYAWSYAKDLIVAGKTSKDFKELDKVASLIYERIKEMLSDDGKKEDSTSDSPELF